jgi:serine/threonine protein kinase
VDEGPRATASLYGQGASVHREGEPTRPVRGTGTVLAERYELRARLGGGGMGEVYSAWDRRLSRDVAIKLLAPALSSDARVRDRFAREAASAARITHHNVVTVFDADECDGDAFIVMERLTGRTLADELRGGPLAPATVREYARQTLDGLGAAHEMGIVHRDVKPSNLLFAADGTLEVADFGIAKSVEADDATATLEIVGSLAYVAPERLHGEPATFRSDLYGLGVVLYETLTGVKPFGGDTPAAVSHAIVAGDHVPVGTRRPDIDVVLASAVERALASEPADRFESASEMASAIASTVPLDATVPIGGVTAVLPTVAASDDRTELRAPPVGGVDVPVGKPSRSEADRPPNLRLLAGVAAVILLALLVAVPFIVASNRTASPGTTVPASTAPATASPPPTQPLPAGLEHAMQQLENAVKP